eukprot:9378358-Heterocapsa_arctica.AAC.1
MPTLKNLERLKLCCRQCIAFQPCKKNGEDNSAKDGDASTPVDVLDVPEASKPRPGNSSCSKSLCDRFLRRTFSIDASS